MTQFLGVYKGIVVNNADPENFGRLQVQVAQVMGGATIQNWAWPNLTNVIGAQVGIPAVGSGVWIMFEGGDPDYPVWTGTWQVQGNIALLSPVIPAGQSLPVPPPPLGVSVVPGNGTVAVSWVPSVVTTQAPVKSYTVTSIPASPQSPLTTKDGTVTQVVFANLINGAPGYEFTVVANSDSGPSDPVISSITVPSGPPGAWPSAPVASPASGTSATIYWPIPPDNGSVISFYNVTISPGGGVIQVFGETNNSTVWSSLTPGQVYSWTVQAFNANGGGSVSVASNVIIPVGQSITVAQGALACTASIVTLSSSNIIATPSGTSVSISQTVLATTLTHPSLTIITGTGNSLSLHGAIATTTTIPILNSSNITGTPSGTGVTLTPSAISFSLNMPSPTLAAHAAPGPPTGVSAVASTSGSPQAVVSFTPPTNIGTATGPLSYTATASPGGAAASGSASPITVVGLTYGTAYTFTVTATGDGTSIPSVASSPPVTPIAPPNPPANLVAHPGNGSITVTFTNAGQHGSAITQYTATASPGGAIGTSVGNPAPLTVTINGLTSGVSYTITITATNAAGTSGPSAAIIASPTQGQVTLTTPLQTTTAVFPGFGVNLLQDPISSLLQIPAIYSGNIMATGSSALTLAVTPLTTFASINNQVVQAPVLISASEIVQAPASGTNCDTLTAFNAPSSITANSVVAPSAPRSVTPHVLSATGIKLNWNKPSNDATTGVQPYTYTVTGNFPGSPITGIASTQLAHQFLNLQSGFTYNFTVTAVNSAGSTSAAQVSAMTLTTGASASLRQGWAANQLPKAVVPITAVLAKYFDHIQVQISQISPNVQTIKTATDSNSVAVQKRGTMFYEYMKSTNMDGQEYPVKFPSGDPGPGNAGGTVGSLHEGFFTYGNFSGTVGDLLGHNANGAFFPLVNPTSPAYITYRSTVVIDMCTGVQDAFFNGQSTYIDGVFLDTWGQFAYTNKPQGVTSGPWTLDKAGRTDQPTDYGNNANQTAAWYYDTASMGQSIFENMAANATISEKTSWNNVGGTTNPLPTPGMFSLIGNCLGGPGPYGSGSQTPGWPNNISNANVTSAMQSLPNGIACVMEEGFCQDGGTAAHRAAVEIPVIRDLTTPPGNGPGGSGIGAIHYGLCKVWQGAPYNPHFIMAMLMVAHNGYNSSIYCFEYDQGNQSGFSYDPITDPNAPGYLAAHVDPLNDRIQLGDPVGDPTTMLTQGVVGTTAMYGREYSNGFVVCNPGSNTSFTLPSTTNGKTYKDFFTYGSGPNISGGGAVTVPAYVVDPPTTGQKGENSHGGYLFLVLQ